MSFQFLQTSMGTLRLFWSEGLLGRIEFFESDEVNSTQEPIQPSIKKFTCVPSGTAFQKRVWAEVAEIPRGETSTYGTLATRIGCPESSRAVANAVGANPLAVVLPCHRVVPAQGGVGGFRWGKKRKCQFLDWEAEGLDVFNELCGILSYRFQLTLGDNDC